MTNSAVQNYLHPPITEAVIEVRVNHVMSTDDIEQVARPLGKVYPHKQIITNYGINLPDQPIGGESLVINSQPRGLRLNSDDQTNIAIITQNSLTVARLAPYLGWDDLYDQFIKAWKSWKKVAKTKQISRIGVRYINRIDIPLKGENKIELEDYLDFYPKVPELGNSPMAEYLIQVTQPLSALPWSATIISTGLQSPLVNNISLLLDIDVFRTESIPMKNEDLWAMIAEARDIKNAVFQSCITQKTMELFS